MDYHQYEAPLPPVWNSRGSTLIPLTPPQCGGEWMQEAWAARTIQKLWRGHRARMERDNRLKAIIVFQKYYRSFISAAPKSSTDAGGVQTARKPRIMGSSSFLSHSTGVDFLPPPPPPATSDPLPPMPSIPPRNGSATATSFPPIPTTFTSPPFSLPLPPPPTNLPPMPSIPPRHGSMINFPPPPPPTSNTSPTIPPRPSPFKQQIPPPLSLSTPPIPSRTATPPPPPVYDAAPMPQQTTPTIPTTRIAPTPFKVGIKPPTKPQQFELPPPPPFTPAIPVRVSADNTLPPAPAPAPQSFTQTAPTKRPQGAPLFSASSHRRNTVVLEPEQVSFVLPPPPVYDAPPPLYAPRPEVMAKPKPTTPPLATPGAVLPAGKQMKLGWLQFSTPDGIKYYHNELLNRTTWNENDALEDATAPPSTPDIWVEYTTEDGRQYFHNRTNNVTVWSRPSSGFIALVGLSTFVDLNNCLKKLFPLLW
eukprot:gene4276-4991_t